MYAFFVETMGGKKLSGTIEEKTWTGRIGFGSARASAEQTTRDKRGERWISISLTSRDGLLEDLYQLHRCLIHLHGSIVLLNPIVGESRKQQQRKKRSELGSYPGRAGLFTAPWTLDFRESQSLNRQQRMCTCRANWRAHTFVASRLFFGHALPPPAPLADRCHPAPLHEFLHFLAEKKTVRANASCARALYIYIYIYIFVYTCSVYIDVYVYIYMYFFLFRSFIIFPMILLFGNSISVSPGV